MKKLPTENKTQKIQGYEEAKKTWISFPEEAEERRKLAEFIAKKTQDRHGGFHGAGIYRTLERVYGQEVSRKRISIEKEINEMLRKNPDIDFKEKVGRKKLYKFKK